MKVISENLYDSLMRTRDEGIEPAWFFYIRAKHAITGVVEDLGLWSGDEDITIAVETPQGGLTTRTFHGQCNLLIDGIQYVSDLTDNPVSVSFSHIEQYAQFVFRGHDLRMAYCEVYACTWNKGALSSNPELQWIGIVDEAPVSTPSVGADGNISLSIRSEMMAQLDAVNPAKSSDEHQRRRDPSDGFSRYSGVIGNRNIRWYQD